MSDNATTSGGRFKIGLAFMTGVALTVMGGVALRGPVNTVTRVGGNATAALLGTNTGSIQQVNGVTVAFRDVIPLTMTGGKAGYNLALARMKDYKITGSGMTTTALVQWINAPAGGTSDLAISKCRSGASYTTLHANSGTLLPNGNNMANSTGTIIGLSNTGAVRVNGDDCIVLKSLTNPTTSGSGYLIIEGREDMSE